jgi:pSer/pThr/pTyr-binding forkhead associated (FHA) protein
VELPASQAGPSSLLVGEHEGAELPATATTLCIIVTRSHRQRLFPLPLGEISLGRIDASHGVFPDLDLSPDGGLQEGVSRQHAKIYQEGNYLFIEDAGSTNGTFLNNHRLTPHVPTALRDGDTLHLGRLQLLVRFDGEP